MRTRQTPSQSASKLLSLQVWELEFKIFVCFLSRKTDLPVPQLKSNKKTKNVLKPLVALHNAAPLFVGPRCLSSRQVNPYASEAASFPHPPAPHVATSATPLPRKLVNISEPLTSLTSAWFKTLCKKTWTTTMTALLPSANLQEC